MEQLFIKASSTTPEVNFDPSGTLLIKGISVPENVNHVFASALAWVDQYAANPAPATTLDISLSYFNTSSSKALLTLLLKLTNIEKQKGGEVIVNWFYEEDDQDMFEAGCDYQQIVKLPIRLIAVKSLNN